MSGKSKSGLLALVVSVITGAGGACSSSTARSDASADTQTSTDLARPDPQPEVGPEPDRPDVGGRCTMPLADVAALCPASYDLIDSVACRDCFNPGLCSYSTASCGSFLIFLHHFNLDSTLCYYDLTSRALVALAHQTDTNGYCGGTAYAYSAGVSPGDCEQQPPFTILMSRYVCPHDGGAVDGDAPDASADGSLSSGG